MGIKGTLSRVATIGGSVVGAGNIRAKQVAIGSASASTDISSKSLLLISFLIMTVSLSKRNVDGTAAFRTSPIGVK